MHRFYRSLLLTATLLAGCGAQESTTEPTLQSLWDQKLSSCALNCHEPDGEQALGPDLSTRDAFYQSLVNRAYSDYPNWIVSATSCSNPALQGLPFINPGKVDQSLLLATLVQRYSDQLTAEYGCNIGYNIHSTNQVTLDNDATFIADLETWIRDGAKNN